MIRFSDIFGTDVYQIPPDADINQATLRLYVYSQRPISDSPATDIYPMQTPWVEGTAVNSNQEGSSCFSVRAYRPDGLYTNYPEDAWGTDGQLHDGPVKGIDFADADYPEMRARTAWDPCFPAEGMWYEWDVTEIVTAWHNGVFDNQGFYGFTPTGKWDYINAYSSEYSDDPLLRPELVVNYGPVACGHSMVPYPEGDMSGPDGVPDCYTDTYDMASLADQWLRCTTPGVSGCQQLDNVYAIPAGTVSVDGSLTEWADATWFTLDEVYYGEPNDIGTGLEDAKFAVKWNGDTDKVYVAVVVDDASHVL